MIGRSILNSRDVYGQIDGVSACVVNIYSSCSRGREVITSEITLIDLNAPAKNGNIYYRQ